MENIDVDFSVVNRVWEHRLRERGLNPTTFNRCVDTGYKSLKLHRLEAQVAEYVINGITGFMASLEVKADLDTPGLGQHAILDLITQRGSSVEDAMKRCANTFMDVTFPALETIFTDTTPQGPGAGTVEITTLDKASQQVHAWKITLGPIHMTDDPHDHLLNRFKNEPPITLILQTLSQYLNSAPRLHWCKIFGTNHATAGLTFGCSLSGQKLADAEAEMTRKFGSAISADWQFRQFMVIRPADVVDQEIVDKLRAENAAQQATAPKKSFWSRLFGR